MKIAATVEVVAARNLRAIGALARREVHLASDDRLDARGFRLLIELDRAEHVAMVGHRDRFHPRRLGVFDQRPDFVRAVEEAVLRVDVKMDETHSGPSPCTGLAAFAARPFPSHLSCSRAPLIISRRARARHSKLLLLLGGLGLLRSLVLVAAFFGCTPCGSSC